MSYPTLYLLLLGMTIGEIVYRVQHLYSRGVPSDDSRLSPRHIYNKLISVRSRLVAQELNKRRVVSKWNFKTLPCVEMILVPPHECDCLPYVGCKVLRSKYKIPKPITSYSKSYITKVSSIDGRIEYFEKEPSKLKYVHASKYNKDKPYYYIQNGHLYTTHTKGPTVLTIEGLFEDSVEVDGFNSVCGKDGKGIGDNSACQSILDKEFDVEADLIDAIVEVSINELVAQFSQMPEDRTNNSIDTQEKQSK